MNTSQPIEFKFKHETCELMYTQTHTVLLPGTRRLDPQVQE